MFTAIVVALVVVNSVGIMFGSSGSFCILNHHEKTLQKEKQCDLVGVGDLALSIHSILMEAFVAPILFVHGILFVLQEISKLNNSVCYGRSKIIFW